MRVSEADNCTRSGSTTFSGVPVRWIRERDVYARIALAVNAFKIRIWKSGVAAGVEVVSVDNKGESDYWWVDDLKDNENFDTNTANVGCSIDFQFVFIRTGWGGDSAGSARACEGLSALLVLAGFESVETLSEPGFFRPAPVLVVVRIARQRFHNVPVKKPKASTVPFLKS